MNDWNQMSYDLFKNYIDSQPIDSLKEWKIQLDDLYYNTGIWTIEDTKYDYLSERLIKLDPTFKLTIGSEIRQGSHRVELPYWMGSLDKITFGDPSGLSKWLSHNLSAEYIVTPKLDGVSCLLVYKNRRYNLYTRGDGSVGTDISHLANYLKLPRLQQKIAVRGELILSKTTFQTKYQQLYKNPRNMVSGLVTGKTIRKGVEDLHFIAYEMVGDHMPKPKEQLQELAKLEFETPNPILLPKLGLEQLKELYIDTKANCPYELDGLVIQSNLSYDRNTNGNPSYAFAFKVLMQDAIHETQVLSVEWNVSKWGSLKPVVIMKPINLNGVTMSRATAHNAKYIIDNKIGPGSVIRVTRSNEVIPYIVEVVKPALELQLPIVPYEWDQTKVNLKVIEEDITMRIKLVAGFFEKVGIKYVSEATVAKLFANGLDTLMKIISASKERLLQVPEFQQKSVDRIYTNIHNGLKNIKLSDILGASGIFGYGIGSKRIETLLHALPNLLDMSKSKSQKELVDLIKEVEGFSDTIATQITAKLSDANDLVEKIQKFATIQVNVVESSTLKGGKYVMTGFRDKKLEEDITRRGGKMVGSVSKNTTAVIIDQKSGPSSKLQKAQELGIPCYDRFDFIKQFIAIDK